MKLLHTKVFVCGTMCLCICLFVKYVRKQQLIKPPEILNVLQQNVQYVVENNVDNISLDCASTSVSH